MARDDFAEVQRKLEAAASTDPERRRTLLRENGHANVEINLKTRVGQLPEHRQWSSDFTCMF